MTSSLSLKYLVSESVVSVYYTRAILYSVRLRPSPLTVYPVYLFGIVSFEIKSCFFYSYPLLTIQAKLPFFTFFNSSSHNTELKGPSGVHSSTDEKARVEGD